tara:strand:+ start:77 stop:262 length:186 start_codon:yes stop_codon:yes gene_type:complete
MIQENLKEEQRADAKAYLQSSKVAEKFSNKLFKENYIGVMQANSVYLDVKKIVYEAMLRTK